MGMRVRLKEGFDTAGYPPAVVEMGEVVVGG
jgi:hypothetical protein